MKTKKTIPVSTKKNTELFSDEPSPSDSAMYIPIGIGKSIKTTGTAVLDRGRIIHISQVEEHQEDSEGYN